jgi:hypothetical protein
MLDFLPLRVLERHSLLELDEKKKRGGLLVSQPFHIPPLPLRQPTSRTMWNMQPWWLNLVRITLEKPERLTFPTNSEQMGPLVDIWRLQSWSTCLFRYRFCSLANNDGKATQVRHSVSPRLPLLLICALHGSCIAA